MRIGGFPFGKQLYMIYSKQEVQNRQVSSKKTSFCLSTVCQLEKRVVSHHTFRCV